MIKYFCTCCKREMSREEIDPWGEIEGRYVKNGVPFSFIINVEFEDSNADSEEDFICERCIIEAVLESRDSILLK